MTLGRVILGLDDLVYVAQLGGLVGAGKLLLYSAVRRSVSALGSLAFLISSRKMMLTAPAAPMTAISVVG